MDDLFRCLHEVGNDSIQYSFPDDIQYDEVGHFHSTLEIFPTYQPYIIQKCKSYAIYMGFQVY